jgi:hypothetical protein
VAKSREGAAKVPRFVAASPRNVASRSRPPPRRSVALGAASALEDARQAGLLDGEKTLGLLALAILAQPDPVAAFLKRSGGRLGESHTLEY